MDAHLYGALQNSVIIFILLFLIVFFCFCFFFGGKLILRDPNCFPPSLRSKLVRCSQTFPRVSLAFVSVKGVALFAIKQSVAAGAFTSSKLPAGAVAELSAPLARCSIARNPVPAPGGVLWRGSSTRGPSGGGDGQ